MNLKEVIKTLELAKAEVEWNYPMDYAVAIDEAIEAVGKQIPKKPKVIDHWRMCPRCYEEYGFNYDILIGMRGLKTGECRCLNCGQVIELEVGQ